ncbi:MAG: hypothetical protein GC161_10470 [Planctomycetaceae bacterium]|nr:hypothetical protein [Planctomycetaceae bacterium]
MASSESETPSPEGASTGQAASAWPDPMPPGELREQAELQARDLLVPPAPLPKSLAWQQLFDADSTRELLARLATGDPLSLRPRVLLRIRTSALLVHADRLLLRALALCAYRGQLYAGRPTLDEWCDTIVRQSVRELLREDLEREYAAEPLSADDEVLFRLFAELFGIETPLTRLASVRYHLVPRENRRVLWTVALEGTSLAALAERTSTPAHQLEQQLRGAFEALSDPRRPTLGELAIREEDFL